MMKKIGLWAKRAVAFVTASALLCLFPVQDTQAVAPSGAIARGIDVSKHNGAVSWGQVAASGINFTFIKVGSTKSGMDPQFTANITGAQAAGIKTGIYLYSYAVTPEQAMEEANLVLQWIAPYTVNYPIVFDLEDKCHKNLSSQVFLQVSYAVNIPVMRRRKQCFPSAAKGTKNTGMYHFFIICACKRCRDINNM